MSFPKRFPLNLVDEGLNTEVDDIVIRGKDEEDRIRSFVGYRFDRYEDDDSMSN